MRGGSKPARTGPFRRSSDFDPVSRHRSWRRDSDTEGGAESNPGPSVPSQASRAEPALPFSAPTVTQACHRRRAQLLLGFPCGPRSRVTRWSLLLMPDPKSEAPPGLTDFILLLRQQERNQRAFEFGRVYLCSAWLTRSSLPSSARFPCLDIRVEASHPLPSYGTSLAVDGTRLVTTTSLIVVRRTVHPIVRKLSGLNERSAARIGRQV